MDLQIKSSYLVRMPEKTDQKNSEYGNFLRSVRFWSDAVFIFKNNVFSLSLY